MHAVLKELVHCKAGELIRLDVNGAVEWVIVGASGNGAFWLAVLTGKDAPDCLNIATDMGFRAEYENSVVLSYGSDYSLNERHEKGCNISGGPLFTAKGSLVQTNEDLLLCCGGRYFNIKTGKTMGLPGRTRAAFAEWILWVGADPAIPAVVFPPTPYME